MHPNTILSSHGSLNQAESRLKRSICCCPYLLRECLLIYAVFSAEVQFGQRMALIGIAVKQ